MDAQNPEYPKSSKERRKRFNAEWKKKNAQANVRHSQTYYQKNRERILSVLRAKYREDTERRERIKQERDMYRDALAKICFIERTECGASKALEIARRSLNV